MTTPGDKRFTTKLVSRQLARPALKAESATVYDPNVKLVVAR